MFSVASYMTHPLPPTPVSVPLARERINVCTFVPLSCHLFLCLVIGGVHLLRLSWLGRGLSICMRVWMVCVSTHVFLPLTPCIRLELALTVHWAHLLLAKTVRSSVRPFRVGALCSWTIP